jgi:excisionase family DNA binding protein
MLTQSPMLVDIKAAAELLGVSDRTVWSLIQRGEGPPLIRLGRSVRFSVESLREWVSRQERRQAAGE